MTTTRGAIPRVKPPMSAEERLARAARVADRAAADVVTAQAAAVAAQAEIDDVLSPAVVTVTEGLQVAQASTNATQTQVDVLAAGGTQSGSATDPSVDLPGDGSWVAGPQVDLTGVVAGNLTITGTGPQQDSNVSASTGFTGEFRIVEVVGGVDTALQTFAFYIVDGYYVSSASTASYSAARTTTGAVSYRIDARSTTAGLSASDLSLYIYARRAA